MNDNFIHFWNLDCAVLDERGLARKYRLACPHRRVRLTAACYEHATGRYTAAARTAAASHAAIGDRNLMFTKHFQQVFPCSHVKDAV
jgi:hypothetical protein